MHPLHPSGTGMSGTTSGRWRPAGGCDHDVCDFAELDVAAWRARQDDPEERLLRLVDELLDKYPEEAPGADERIDPRTATRVGRGAQHPDPLPRAAIVDVEVEP